METSLAKKSTTFCGNEIVAEAYKGVGGGRTGEDVAVKDVVGGS